MSVFIEKVEIKHFRSFDGGVKQPKVEMDCLKDVNIISGANDSGKSNILRALNLFFNNEISPGIPFNMARDLCKSQKKRSDSRVEEKRFDGAKDVRQRDLWVKVRVHFYNQKHGILPQRFWVEKLWDKSNYGITSSNHKKDGLTQNQKRAADGQLTQFLKQFSFEYVPAIKDRQYFSSLFGKLQKSLFEKETSSAKKFKNTSKEFDTLLLSETKSLFEEFKKNTKIDARFNIPESLIDFVRTLSVQTENGISLFERGDGIQARFIPDILNEIYKSSGKKKIIWGFEEPENSYEDKNLRKLRDDFLNLYSKTKQIFLTTHSFNILSVKGENVSRYRVYRDGETSQIILADKKKKDLFAKSEDEKLQEELGIFELTDELDQLYQEKETELESLKKVKSDLEIKLKKESDKVIVVEDTATEKILKKVLSDNKFEIKIAGCADKVLNISKIMKGRYNNLYFLVDGDLKQYSNEEKKLWHKNTKQLNKYCIENYLFLEDVISEVIAREKIKTTKAKFIKSLCKKASDANVLRFSDLLTLIEDGRFNWADLNRYDMSEFTKRIKCFFNIEQYDFIDKCLQIMEEKQILQDSFNEVINWLNGVDNE